MSSPAIPLLVLEHLGKLHAYEAWLVYVLAFGPFLLLAVTIRIARRRLRDEDEGTAEGESAEDRPATTTEVVTKTD